ncbi:MAG: signal peptidase II [bacterium]|nr:signal peptidase II [bacterium]
MKKKILLGFPVALTVLFLDRLSKVLISRNMFEGESTEVIGNFFRFTYVRNPFAAFSINFGGYWIMMALWAVAVVFVILYFYRTEFQWVKITALGMIIGGAFGNGFDRIKFREVTDFLDFGIGRNRFAIFNVADTCVFIGVCLLILLMYLEKDEAKT